ncbi:hydroxymethylglutaryl-CoA lyase [Paraflavitalea sp. CAU 1676]|uniref:hydroxymethylglutaryl-CoA lyase n=1 Tax=Paraflavitalea sp. CAU 1676 TaxID=3032598 RepID=UPI0023D9F6C4|nr:hydroxymethylglutaryl-CoA lyase [Paraflavitalea sp. CAU 1676]MDF2187779.1 hydroxymethylglutaryl-CoA lyase [Paraflavitalea sp. CAU 1676]
MQELVKLVECPRDAMQGWKSFIPTEEKVDYLNTLLQVGFDTLDCGSFVSAKAIPQMVDTKEVLARLDLSGSNTRLLTIVANERGAQDAVAFEQVSFLGFPFSISETFQLRNTNSTIAASLGRVQEIQNLCIKSGKQLVVYISMGFGNPYGDPYSAELVFEWVDKLVAMDIGIISLADTVGVATPQQVRSITEYLVKALPNTEIGVHLHAAPLNQQAKLEAAVQAGCRRIDGALKGIGGCPMANDDLVGNMNTEWMIGYLELSGLLPVLNTEALLKASRQADVIFAAH